MEFVYKVPKYLDLASAELWEGEDFDSFFATTTYKNIAVSYSPQEMSSSVEDLSQSIKTVPEEASPRDETVSIGSVSEVVNRSSKKSHNQENKPPRDKKGARRRSRSFAMGCPLGESYKNRANRDKYISLAEAIQHFHKDTPVRFRMKPSKVSNENNKSGGNVKVQYTIAKSPNLKTQLRIRPVNYLPHDVQQELEMQEIRRHKFKALPLNSVILKQQPTLKVVAPKPITKPMPFALTEVKPSRKVPAEEQAFQFKANPVPKSIHLCSNSSNGDTSNRGRTPDTSQSDSKTYSSASATASVYERSRLMQQKREEKIKQVFEEEKRAREFHANPIPKCLKNPHQRSLEASPNHTKPEPFKLHTEQRMVVHEKKRLEVSVLRKELAKQRLAEVEAMHFKAQPATVLQKEPFVPKKPEHQTLQIPELVLNTEVRAKKREEFDKMLKEKELLVERYKADELEKQQLEDELERARLRREATFKAQPIRVAAPPVILPSEKVLTVAQSPSFRKKALSKSQ